MPAHAAFVLSFFASSRLRVFAWEKGKWRNGSREGAKKGKRKGDSRFRGNDGMKGM
jgi:hypothetical protein